MTHLTGDSGLQGVQAKMQSGELANSLLSAAKLGPEQAVWTKHKPYCGMKV